MIGFALERCAERLAGEYCFPWGAWRQLCGRFDRMTRYTGGRTWPHVHEDRVFKA